MSTSSPPPPGPSPSSPPADAALVTLVDQRLGLYTGLLSADELTALRDVVLDAAAAHPNLRPWAGVLREHAPKATTGEEPKHAEAAGPAPTLQRRTASDVGGGPGGNTG